MRVKHVRVEVLENHYTHPAIILFRGIELHTIYRMCKSLQFESPSLDIGCGDGIISYMLFNDLFDIGLDNNEANDVREAIDQKRYKKVLIESAEHVSIETNTVNSIFSNCVLEHIPDVKAVLSEVGRILKPGGKFVFTVPSHRFADYLYYTAIFRAIRLERVARMYARKRNQLLNHYHCYSRLEWQKLLAFHNIKISHYRYYISKKSLMLWDKLASIMFVADLCNVDITRQIYSIYESRIRESVEHDRCTGEEGACLCIVGEKQ